MKTIGIVAEYNPFHNGHAFQLAEVRRAFGEDAAVVAAMSGDFTQRGEPAIADKWVRAEAALRCGVDLVLEIPFAWAAASAERFAAGGVGLLAATGICGRVAFGSESGSLDALRPLADVLAEEPEAFRTRLRERLDEGLSFPAAREAALGAYLAAEGLPGDASRLGRPNDILAVEYLKALRRLGPSAPKPFAVRRAGAGYHDTAVPSAPGAVVASATALRAAFLGPTARAGTTPAVDRSGIAAAFAAVRPGMPAASAGLLLEAALDGTAPVFPDALAPLLLAQLRAAPAERLDRIAYMGEGLSRRLQEAAAASDAPDADAGLYVRLLARAATRRFPSTRIARALAALAVGLTEDDLAALDAAGGPRYLRVLGFSKKGRYLLKKMRESASLPVFTKASDFLEHGSDAALRRSAELDLAAADLYRRLSPDPDRRRGGLDFDRAPVQLR